MHEKLSSPYKAHDKENLLVRLENVVHANQEWMIGLKQDILFKLGAFDLIIVDDYVFPETLHGKVVSIIFFLH